MPLFEPAQLAKEPFAAFAVAETLAIGRIGDEHALLAGQLQAFQGLLGEGDASTQLRLHHVTLGQGQRFLIDI